MALFHVPLLHFSIISHPSSYQLKLRPPTLLVSTPNSHSFLFLALLCSLLYFFCFICFHCSTSFSALCLPFGSCVNSQYFLFLASIPLCFALFYRVCHLCPYTSFFSDPVLSRFGFFLPSLSFLFLLTFFLFFFSLLFPSVFIPILSPYLNIYSIL